MGSHPRSVDKKNQHSAISSRQTGKRLHKPFSFTLPSISARSTFAARKTRPNANISGRPSVAPQTPLDAPPQPTGLVTHPACLAALVTHIQERFCKETAAYLATVFAGKNSLEKHLDVGKNSKTYAVDPTTQAALRTLNRSMDLLAASADEVAKHIRFLSESVIDNGGNSSV